MALLTIPTTFAPSTVAKSSEVNANFAAIATAFNATAVQTDVAKTITVSHTQAADLLFSDALYDIGKTGATRPRDGFFSRNLTVGGTLTATSVVAASLVAPAATALQLGANGTPYVGISTGGVTTFNTAVTASAAAGDIVLKNLGALRVANNAGTDTFAMVKLDGNGFVQLGTPSWLAPSRITRDAVANIAAAAPGASGAIVVDLTNNRFVYYTDAGRYYLAGTAF